MTAFRGASELIGIVAYDLMLRQTWIIRTLASSQRTHTQQRRPLQDADVSEIQEWMQRHEIRRISKETTQQATDLIAGEYAFHPVQDYLNGTPMGRHQTPRHMAEILSRRQTPTSKIPRRCRPLVPHLDGRQGLSARMQMRLHDRAGGPARNSEINSTCYPRRRMVRRSPPLTGTAEMTFAFLCIYEASG